MAITEYNYIPTYIKRTIANKPKDVVTASYWNELFNLLITQGDHTAEELGNVLNHFTTAINEVKGIADGKYIKPTNGIPKTDLAAAVQTSLDKADSALQSVPSTYRTASAQDLIDNTKQDKLIAGENITIADDGKTISATSDMDDVIGYFRVTLTERGDGLYTGSKTFAQVKAEIESNKRFMFIDGYDCVLIVTRVGNALIEFAGMSDGTDGWLWVGVASDDRWEVVPEVRVTSDWYNLLADDIGNLLNLTTADKTSLVAAVNEVKQTADDKQAKLIAGENITIAADGKTISAIGGLTTAQVNALDGMFKVCAFTKDNVSAEYTAFKTAFGIADSGGGGGSGETGVSNESTWTDGVAYTFNPVNDTYIESNGTETAYNNWSSSPYLYCDGASQLVFTVLLNSSMLSINNNYNAFYDENKTFISTFSIDGIGNASIDGIEIGATKEITIPKNAAYFRVSHKDRVYGNIDSGNTILSITPKA